jgi:hypothetical protein
LPESQYHRVSSMEVLPVTKGDTDGACGFDDFAVI